MKSFISILLLAQSLVLWGQHHDYLWTFGGKALNSIKPTNFGLIQFDFRLDPPIIYIDSLLWSDPQYAMYHGYVSVSMCDSVGNHQFYSSGVRFKNYLHQEINGGPFYLAPSSFNAPQQAIGLPIGGQKGRYYFIQDSTDFFVDGGIPELGAFKLWYSIIDMRKNNGLGRIDPVRVEVLNKDTLMPGKISAVKHGNGRDWWILKGGYRYSNLINKILAKPDTLYLHDVQSLIVPEQYAAGQALFSPGGGKYIVTLSYRINEPGGFVLYDFDRCSGILSVDTFKMYSGGNIFGAAFSPEGRFLYVSANDTLFQYDFHAPDLLSSETVVAIYDPTAAPGHTNFFRSMMGPDGKIYWATPGGTKYLNVIEDPHEKGMACNVRQALYMGAFMSSTQANYPNYRLGPWDGSPCDTLGLDNIPLAEFRVRSDSTLTVRFIDRSAYEPEQWYWTFGDGGTSTAIHPVHSYAAAGTYEVCLLVSNSNGSDTYCRTITLGTVATEDIRAQAQVKVFPNPASEYLSVNIAGFHPIGANMELVNMQGQLCLTSPLSSGLQTIPLPLLPTGLYIWRVVLGGAVLDYGRVVIE